MYLTLARNHPVGVPSKRGLPDDDDWAVYDAVRVHGGVRRTTLLRRFRFKGWAYSRFDDAIARLRANGVIDVAPTAAGHPGRGCDQPEGKDKHEH